MMNVRIYTARLLAATLLALPCALPARNGCAEPDTLGRLVLGLDDCLNTAREGNVALRNARLDIEAAKHQKREAFAEYFPSVSINAVGFYSIDPMLDLTLKDFLGSSDMAHNIINQAEQISGQLGLKLGYTALDYGYMVSASIMQPLFAGGRIVNGNRLAKVGIHATELQTDIVRKQQEEEIAAKYWQMISLNEKEKSLESGEKLADNVYMTVNSARKAGLALDLDLLMVEKERNNLKSKRTRLESGKRLAKMDLLNTIGQPYALLSDNATAEKPFIDNIEFSNSEEELEEPESYYVDEFEAASSSNETRLLDLSVEAARLQKKMEVGKTMPEIGVGFAGGYGRVLGPDSEWNGVALAKVSIPITDWWKVSHKARRLDIKVEQACNQRDFLHSQLALKVQMLWEEVLCTWEEMEIAGESVALSEKAYLKMQSRYSAGDATMSDYLKSSSDLQLALDEYSDKKIAYRTALREYTNMTGRNTVGN